VAISIVGSATADSGTGTGTPTISLPAGIASGDLLVTLISTVAAAVPAAVTGWTLLINQSNTTAGSTIAVYTRVADGTEAASYTFGLGGARRYASLMVAVRGAGTTVDVSFTNVDTTASATMDSPGGTIAAASEYVLSLFAARSVQAAITDTPDAGTTEVVASANPATTSPWAQASFAYELAGSTTAAVRTNSYNVNVTGYTTTLALTAPSGGGASVVPAAAGSTSGGSGSITAISKIQPTAVASGTSGGTAAISAGSGTTPANIVPAASGSSSAALGFFTAPTTAVFHTPLSVSDGNAVITVPSTGPANLVGTAAAVSNAAIVTVGHHHRPAHPGRHAD
jgi:hypothetical protein